MLRTFAVSTTTAVIVACSCVAWQARQREAGSLEDSIFVKALLLTSQGLDIVLGQHTRSGPDIEVSFEEGEDLHSLMQISTGWTGQMRQSDEESLLQVGEKPLVVQHGVSHKRKEQTDEESLLQVRENPVVLQQGDTHRRKEPQALLPNATQSSAAANNATPHAGKEITEVSESRASRKEAQEASAKPVKLLEASTKFEEALAGALTGALSAGAAEEIATAEKIFANASQALISTSPADALRKQEQISRLRDIVGWFSIAVLCVLILVSLFFSANRPTKSDETPGGALAMRAQLNEAS